MSDVEPEDPGEEIESEKEKGNGKEIAIAVVVEALASFHMGEMRMPFQSHHLA